METGERGQDGFRCVSMKGESAGWHWRNLVLLGFPVGANVDVPHGGTQAFFQPKGWFEASRGQTLAEPVAPELGSKSKATGATIRLNPSSNPGPATFLARLLSSRALRATEETERLRRSVALPLEKPRFAAVGWPPRPSRVARSGTPERGESANRGRLLRSTVVGLMTGRVPILHGASGFAISMG